MNLAARSSSRVGFSLLALLAVGISLVSFRLLSFDASAVTVELRANVVDHPIPFYIHTTFAPIALLVGIWQFLPVTRRSSYHRWAGRIYVVCCLVAAVAGFIVAFTTSVGMAAGAAFAILAVLWFAATSVGFLAARAGEYRTHRRWMMRSYALTCAAISLRIILPVGLATGLAFETSYVIAAWGCWLVNLAIVQCLIWRTGTTTVAHRLTS